MGSTLTPGSGAWSFSFSLDTSSSAAATQAFWFQIARFGVGAIAPRTGSKPNSWDQYRDIIYQTDNDKNFTPQILDCMAGIESRWNPSNVTGSHRGLFQMDPNAWRDSGTTLSYDNYVKDPRASSAVAVGALYKKLVYTFGTEARFRETYNKNGGIFARQQVWPALTLWRGSPYGIVNQTYATAIQNCADAMMAGNGLRGYDWVYWYGSWENSYIGSLRK